MLFSGNGEILSEDFVKGYADKQPPWGFNGMGYLVYKRTYAREVGGRTEEWYETVARCVNGAQEIGAGYTQEEAERLYDYVFNLKGSFSGRALWQLGTDLVKKFNATSLTNCFYTNIECVDDFKFLMDHLMLGGGVGFSVERSKIHEFPKVRSGVSITHDKTNDADFIVPDSRQGWSKLLGNVLDAYFHTGESFTYSTILVRGYGAPLKTFGGTASGPEVLVEGISDICNILNKRQGKKIRSIDALDIANVIGQIVVAGSARRSAQLAAGDPDDFLFLRAKNWDRGDIPAWRGNSNNSIYADSYDEIVDELWGGYDGSGEPYGLLNRKLARTVGRIGERVPDPSIEGFNPCQPAWATVLTKEGLSTIGDIQVGDYIWSETGWTKVVNKWSTGHKQVRAYRTTSGVFYGTANHRVVCDGTKVEAQNANGIDALRGPLDGPVLINPQDVMDGLVMGDGSVHKASNNLVYLYIGNDDHDYFDSEVAPLITAHRPGITEEGYSIKTQIAPSELPMTYERRIPKRYMSNRTSLIGFLRGLYSANGSVVGKGQRVTLKTASAGMRDDVQVALSSLGIKSYYTTNKANVVQFANGEYECRESYDINITTDRSAFRSLIGFIQQYKNDKIDIPDKIRDGKTTFDIKHVEDVSFEEVFDITVDNDTHTYWTGGVNVSNCGEIGLGDGESCNLATLFLPNIESKEELFDLSRLLYKTQKAITDLGYPYEKTMKAARKNRRLGQSITGWLQSTDEQLSWVDECYNMLKDFDKEYSQALGIEPSIKLTSCQPSGTLSLLPGITPGVHPAYARYYIRRVRMGANDPLVDFCRDRGYPVRYDIGLDGKENHSRFVVEFPCESPEGSIMADDMSAIDQLEWVVRIQKLWVDNAVSVTVNYSPEELPEIKQWLKKNYTKKIKSVSFLLREDHGFALPPYEKITEKEYEKMLSKISNDNMAVVLTDTEMLDTGECATGACPVR